MSPPSHALHLLMRVAARGGVSSSTTRKEGLVVLFMSEEGKFISFFSQMEREREEILLSFALGRNGNWKLWHKGHCR